MDISGNFSCKFFKCHATLLSAPLLGLSFNEVSRDEGNRVVLLQNAQSRGTAPSQTWESPFSQKFWHRWWLIKKIQVNVLRRWCLVRRTQNPLGELKIHKSSKTKPTGGKINNLYFLNDNFQGYHLAAFRAEFRSFAGGWMRFFPLKKLAGAVNSLFCCLGWIGEDLGAWAP